MKLTRLRIENVLGLKTIDLALSSPVVAVAGLNGAGKSSLSESIRLALTAETPRADLIKEYGALVREGAKSGRIEVHATGADPYIVQISAAGKVEDSHKGDDTPEALPYVLDPSLFAAEKADQRRAFLFALMRLSCDGPAVTDRLIKRGCEQAKVEAIAPILRAGFDAAQKRAAENARDAKSDWKAVTGEQWGSQKAEKWRAPAPAFSGDDAAALTKMDKALAGLQEQLADANKRLGVAEYERSKANDRTLAITELRARAKTHAEHSALVNTAAKELERLKAALLDAQQKAGQAPMRKPTLFNCPECRAALCMDPQDDGKMLLSPYPILPQDPPYDPESAARIPELQKAIVTQQRVLERHQQNEREADEAGRQLKALEDFAAQPSPDVEKPEVIRQTVETLKSSIATQQARQRELQAAQKALDEADNKTKSARQHHANVIGWTAIADALAPDGIPGEILSEALGPINHRLAQSAADSGWRPVTIGDDMAIRYGGRPYRICSESERFRADAMLAEAISFLSGLKLLVLDRFDVLDLPARGECLNWLGILADEKEIDCAIVLGTLKQPVDWEGVQSVWLQRGEIAQFQREQVAA